jgi:hypothetical protein
MVTELCSIWLDIAESLVEGFPDAMLDIRTGERKSKPQIRSAQRGTMTVIEFVWCTPWREWSEENGGSPAEDIGGLSGSLCMVEDISRGWN